MILPVLSRAEIAMTPDLLMCGKVHSSHRGRDRLMTTDDEARERLTARLDARRIDLRMQWGDVASKAGMSTAHLRRIRHNEAPLTPLMKTGLERALMWTAGTIDGILAGESTAEPTAAGQARTVDRRYEDSAEQKIWEITELPPVVRRQLIGVLRVTLEALEDDGAQPDADVREFRPRA
jgi:hypothetical protein